MAALDPQAVLSEANCYACYGVSITDMLKLGLLSRIAEAGLDPVASFVARAGLTDQTLIDAVQVLHDSAVANGWWDLCDCIYPIVGGDAQSHAQNLKSSNFTIQWHGTVTHDANGITGDGATGYGDTTYIPASSGMLSLNSAHLGVFRATAGTVGRDYMAASNGVNLVRLSKGLIGDTVGVVMNCATNSLAASALFSLVVGTRIDSSNQHLMIGGVDNSFAFASVGVPAVSVFILASDQSGVAGSWSNVRLAGATIGAGVTFAQYTSMASDWQTFNTAVGR